MKLLLALFLAAFVAVITSIHGAAVAAPFAFVALALLAGPAAYLRGQLGAAPDTNDIASELQISAFLDAALATFKRAVLPLTMFSTVFRAVQLQGNDKVEVPYLPLQGIGSKDFSSSYSFATGAGSKQDVREITVNKRKYQPLAFTSSELARQPRLSIESIGALKGEKLGYDIVQDILSVVTADNFGPAVFTGAASGFDSDDLADIRGACNSNRTGAASVTDGATTNTSTTVTSATARFTSNDLGITISGTGIPASTTIASVTNGTTAVLSAAATATATGLTFTLGRPIIPWPETGRGLMVNPDYDTALMKDNNLKAAYALGSDSVITEGKLPRVMQFDYAQTPAIPGNGENLVGFASYKSAIGVAFSPVQPADGGKIVRYETRTDEATQITLEYREWFQGKEDTLYRVIEANYGYTALEKLALKRLVSA